MYSPLGKSGVDCHEDIICIGLDLILGSENTKPQNPIV